MSLSADPIAAAAAPAVIAPGVTRIRPDAVAADTGDSVSVRAMPASPPAEVVAEMRTAAGAYDRLAAEGQTLRFSLDAVTGRLSVSLAADDGTTLRSISPSTVLHIAGGGSAA